MIVPSKSKKIDWTVLNSDETVFVKRKYITEYPSLDWLTIRIIIYVFILNILWFLICTLYVGLYDHIQSIFFRKSIQRLGQIYCIHNWDSHDMDNIIEIGIKNSNVTQ